MPERDTENADEQINDAEPDQPHRRGGGPRTPEGKARSAQNALKHGCCSEQIVLNYEDPAEFEAIKQQWFEDYSPVELTEIRLVEQLVINDWFLQRAQRRLAEIEVNLPKNGWTWSDSHKEDFEKFSRYRNTAERNLLRVLKDLESRRKTRFQEHTITERLALQRAKINARALTKKEKALQEKDTVSQRVFVKVAGGQAFTYCIPSNKLILKEVARRPKDPVVVKRTLEFPDGVPSEYSWLHPEKTQEIGGGMYSQLMWYPDWLKTIEREQASGSRHVGPEFPGTSD